MQIQLPEPLFGRLLRIAQVRDISVAEVIRRGMESYVMSCPEADIVGESWTLPVLRGSGGHLVDPASVKGEVAVMDHRLQKL